VLESICLSRRTRPCCGSSTPPSTGSPPTAPRACD
jgi:hypothetical protein